MNRPEVKEHISIASKRSQYKRKETNINKYGSEVPAIGINWKDDYEKNYGVRHPKQREENKEKMRGDNNPSKLIDVKNKIKKNRWINKTKDELDIILNKTKDTWIRTMAKDNPLKSEEIKQKIREKNIKKYGVDWVTKDQNIKNKIKNSNFLNIKEKVFERLTQLNLELTTEFINVTDKINIKCLICNTIFDTVLDYVFHGYGLCPTCFPLNISYNEQEIKDYVKLILPDEELIYNDRKILEGKELDILIPNKNIAIEHDGIYFHSEEVGVSQNYHLDKTNLANKKKIRLIHIFEDEWVNKKDIVKDRLKRILNIDNSLKVYARNCIIKEIDMKTKNIFLDNYHIQGKDISSIKLGAFFNNELVSVMTFSKGNISKGSIHKEGVWELNRFCVKHNFSVIGIAGKLLTFFKRNYKWSEIFSYCDLRWSEGNLYYKLGFNLVKTTKPNYWYVKGMKRIHRFNLRKKRSDPKDVPEWILRHNEGYYRLWDCGNLKFNMLS